MATWAVVKAQARDMLGINLTDADVDNVPLLATDAYGNFIPGPNGFPQVVMTRRRTASPARPTTSLVEGNPAAPIDLDQRRPHRPRRSSIDIAHTAVPVDATAAC